MRMKQSFEHVVSEHGTTVLRVCRAVLGPQADADDAWSETFLAAMRAWPDLPEEANVEAWLVTIAHRKAIDITRARRRHAVAVGELPERVSDVGIPERSGRDTWDAVKALPDKQRQAVAYHYLAGLPYSDIAGILGGSTDAARRAASDGMKSLRKVLAGADPKGAAR
ncbi:MAG TPA: sigma-70 family RNA polymerase sigma factor [Mycobacteriales bacterium]|jgi:RNA polymerase sigma factor (sigma-70 family)|nr:sigma-70 family RNA polymerase sigma factor [Mycobacteriales bacterium]